MKITRILVSGSRTWTDKQTMLSVLQFYFAEGDVCIIEGGAVGADSLAKEIFYELKDVHKRQNSTLLEFPAKWGDIDGKPADQIGIRKGKIKYWKAAGPMRNIQMLDEGCPEIVICFANDIIHSKGTFHMLSEANKRHISVLLVPAKKETNA